MLSPGAVLSERYHLTERIAAGGMGEVWRGTDLVLHRPVAVKVLLPGLAADTGFIARFRTEARMMASLRHPGIVQVYDFGESGDGSLDYLVMEFIEGTSLARRIEAAGKLGAAETVAIVGQVADALQAAHDAGIIHRDVKPSNLLVRPGGALVLVDFGVARSTTGAGLTGTNVVMGSAHYMAPEQAEGKPVTPATDVYALGAVAYTCLTGRPPYVGDNPLQVIAQLVVADPPTLPVDVPPQVTAVVLRALEKDPAARHQSAAAFAAAARVALTGQGPSRRIPPAASQPTVAFTGPLGAAPLGPLAGMGDRASAEGAPGMGRSEASGGRTATTNPGAGGATLAAGGAGFGGGGLGAGGTGGAGFGGADLAAGGAGGGGFGGAGLAVGGAGGGSVDAAGPAVRNAGGAGGDPVARVGAAAGNERSGAGAGRWRKAALVVAAAVLMAGVGVGIAVATRPEATPAQAQPAGPGRIDVPGFGPGDGPGERKPLGRPTSAAGRSGSAAPSVAASARTPVGGSPSVTEPGGPAPGTTGTADPEPTATATDEPATNPYKPQAVCGKAFAVIDQAALKGADGALVGRVYLLYNAATRKNCTVTIKLTDVGTASDAAAYLEVEGAARTTDSGSFEYYAGPVRAKAAATCVRWGGSVGGAGYDSPLEHCG